MDHTAAIQELQKRIAFYEDMKAYNRLFTLLSGGLQRFSFSLVKSKEVAEEIVSDVFIKVWQMRARLTEIGNLKVYCYTIAKHFSLNYIAQAYKHTIVSLNDLDLADMVSINGPAELCISADLVRQIRQAIQQLPPQCRLIFQLVKEEGLRYKEVAAILEISPLTVRNQLAIAVRKIGETLPDFFYSPLVHSSRKTCL